MGWLNFIVEMTKALAWPVVVVVLLLVFRLRVSKLLGRILTLRWGSWQAEFREEGNKVAEQIGRSDTSALINQRGDDKLFELAERSPRTAIIESAIQIETALRAVAGKHIPDVEGRHPTQLIRLLKDSGVLDRSAAESLQGLFIMRNLAVHNAESELTVSKALDFIALANAIIYVLETKK